MRDARPRLWLLLVGVLAGGWLLATVAGVVARPAHRGAGHRHFHHRHSHSHAFLGFGFYGSPYSPYYDSYYYYPYASGEHRRFPAFRLPGLFPYLGALGKGEEGQQALP